MQTIRHEFVFDDMGNMFRTCEAFWFSEDLDDEPRTYVQLSVDKRGNRCVIETNKLQTIKRFMDAATMVREPTRF